VCGYLKPELASMADEILLKSEPVEIHARDLRPEAPPVPQPAAEDVVATGTPPAGHPLAAVYGMAEPHPLDPPTMFEPPFEPHTEVTMPPEHLSPAPAADRDHREPPTPHRERHAVREFMRPVALVAPEGEPRITRLVDVINDEQTASAPPERARHEQPALVVDDFAWDLDDDADDYSAPV